MLLEGTGFAHGFFVGVLNENGGGPQGQLVSLVVGRREAQQPSIVRRPSGIVVELEVDLPEATIVTDGRKVLSVGGGGRSRWIELRRHDQKLASPQPDRYDGVDEADGLPSLRRALCTAESAVFISS